MNDIDAVNTALLVLRLTLALVMLAHGVNHIFGGGKIAGTAGWFGSMGMRPAKLQAWLASLTEVGAGVLLALGLLHPLGCAAVVGVMTVAFVINHRGNGFFIFRPGEGWEYVMTLALVALASGTLGPGEWALDRALDIDAAMSGWSGLAITAIAGFGGAAALLATSWRPPRPEPSTTDG